MKIHLNSMEISALQNVARNPGKRTLYLSEMVTYGLVTEFEEGYKITEGGKAVLNDHLPYLCNGQNMKEPLGMNKPFKRK